jgi:hypothetical protein
MKMTNYGKPLYSKDVAILSDEDVQSQIELGPNSINEAHAYPIYISVDYIDADGIHEEGASVGLTVASAQVLRAELDKLIARFEAIDKVT